MLDLSRVVAGPFATAILADLGADVIKIERPRTGDDYRYGPSQEGQTSLAFENTNRGKRSITLDVGTPAGRDIFLRLVERADVVVENFRSGWMAAQGLGADVLRARNPRLVVAALSGFGATGPRAGQASYDIVAQASGGLLGDDRLRRRSAGTRRGARSPISSAACTSRSASSPAFSIATGTAAPAPSTSPTRMRSSRSPTRGRRSPPDSASRPSGSATSTPSARPTTRSRRGTAGWSSAPPATSSSAVSAPPSADPSSPRDERYKHHRGRARHRAEVNGFVGAWVRERTCAEVLAALGPGGADVPCAAVARPDELIDDPQLRARGMIERHPHPPPRRDRAARQSTPVLGGRVARARRSRRRSASTTARSTRRSASMPRRSRGSPPTAWSDPRRFPVAPLRRRTAGRSPSSNLLADAVERLEQRQLGRARAEIAGSVAPRPSTRDSSDPMARL